MFDKILIANRGEIACRIISTARRLGIATVAVYSDADRDSLHAEMADEAVRIGPPPSTMSYLAVDRIVEACRSTGSDAVHPGYGFLSENPAFPQALAAAGVTFIGPPVAAVKAMGDKITSKRIAEEAGVNSVPGHLEALSDAQQAVRIARTIGYPVMLKASAGGGGKGMRVANDDAECRHGFERARSEASSSFGDDRIFVEKFITEPRHIEIQVLADTHGNVIHLGERECSIQRRHQKVIEEAPSPFVDAEMRAAMGAQAVTLARSVGYHSAGTVEFIVAADHSFYFLEMNTRLQVEHPITEAVTGLDLVELMIRIAAGEPLDIKQADVKMDGWAIESRLYAEDPQRGFLPSCGRLVRYRPPLGGDVRLDSGVREGGEIPIYYDPMIAKLITHADDRPAAIATMRRALDEFYLRGISHNMNFLAAVIKSPRFAEGRLSTNFIDEEFADGYDPGQMDEQEWRTLVCVATSVHQRLRRRARGISGRMSADTFDPPRDWLVIHGDKRSVVTITCTGDCDEVVVDGSPVTVDTDWVPGVRLFKGAVDGGSVCAQVERVGVGYRLAMAGIVVEILVLSPRSAALYALMPVKEGAGSSKFLLAPMPGLLVSVAVQSGDEVDPGQELAVVEAMKMENVLRADEQRTVASVLVSPGESLSVDQPIIEFV
ncbi:MAG: acetyl/propionyl/methylcrotonyl-CoA carboxylase subunit alpha [Gammaproteobacteria bacterium]|nr:MAG: acetyl/propionyl/methylcrotonyl-CoA carboxylase subunit alpha [Gammaproteobacteria bacterium]